MDENRLISGAVQLLILLLAVSVHECSHAWTARRYGDSRLSFYHGLPGTESLR